MPIRTMVIDDTILYRKITSDALKEFNDIEVIGTAPSGDLAVRKLRQHPADLVFCDINMPGMSGIETLEAINKEFPNTFVIMMSGISGRSADVTIEALGKGAVDFIKKPDGTSLEENMKQLVSDIAGVLRLVRMRISMRGGAASLKPEVRKQDAILKKEISVPSVKKPIIGTFSVLAIGVSTGGPEALNNLIPKLPANLPVPVVLVQHMPKGFTKSLAESLDRKSSLRVIEGTDGDVLKAGTVYIAPGGTHMVLREKNDHVEIGLNDGPPENSCKPAVDVLFRSVASVYGSKGVLSLILTGMGSDGMKGLRVLKRKKCYSITQSSKTCVVYGMPKSVDDAGLSDISLDLDDIANEIKRALRI